LRARVSSACREASHADEQERVTHEVDHFCESTRAARCSRIVHAVARSFGLLRTVA
jgi:hypothetical protein